MELKSIERNYRFEIFNLGNNKCEDLKNMIQILQDSIGIRAEPNSLICN